MYRRLLSRLVRGKLAQFPSAALLGPRQCGKTTLAKSLSKNYFDLEQEEERLRLDLQWQEAFAKKKLIVLDEAQTWPEIFPRLRGWIDAHAKVKGKFLLLGSVSPVIMHNVSESLAGRLALCELTPFFLSELSGKKSVDQLWLYGGYPAGEF